MTLIIPLSTRAEVAVDVSDEHSSEPTGIEHRIKQSDDDVVKDCGDETEKQES